MLREEIIPMSRFSLSLSLSPSMYPRRMSPVLLMASCGIPFVSRMRKKNKIRSLRADYVFALTPPDGMLRTSGPCNRFVGDSYGRVENDEFMSVDWDTSNELEHGHKSENEHCGDGDGILEIQHDKKEFVLCESAKLFEKIRGVS